MQIPSLMFRTDLSGLTFFQREGGYERLSTYRFHNQDPLVFNGGGKLLWWVGQCKPFSADDDSEETLADGEGVGTTKCGNPYPDKPLSPPPPPPVPPQPPALAGCADGQCEAFCHLDNVHGCRATWDKASLRAKKSAADKTTNKKACGGDVPCAVPADACAPGWEVCLSDPAAVRNRSLMPFVYINDQFTKTGSGQKYRENSKSDAFWKPCCTETIVFPRQTWD